MTSNIMRNFFNKRATRLYPVVQREPFAQTRGAVRNDIEKCIFCSICATKCPSRCITVDKKAGTWTCDPFACIYCGICVDNCPTSCLSQIPAYQSAAIEREPLFYQGTPPKPKSKDSAPSS